MISWLDSNSNDARAKVSNVSRWGTWLVADLEAKELIQNQILETTNCLPETAVLRANEFWRQILKVHFSGIDLVSTQFLSVWLHEWLKEKEVEWAKSPGASALLLNYLEIFLPVLARSSQDTVTDWLKQNSDAMLSWGHWFYLSVEAWSVLSEKNILLAKWIPAFLAGREDLPDRFWPHDVVLDLGPALTGVEAELFEKLARQNKVTVILPELSARSSYPQTFSAYELLGASNEKGNAVTSNESPHVSYHKFSSELAEVKAAVHWLREAADRGVNLNQLGLFSPDIERYWPLLEAYFRVEGLPARKSVVVSAASLPLIQNWLSRLRVESKHISTGDLETIIFGAREFSKDLALPYEKFAPIFRSIYDEADLNRDTRVRQLFNQKFQPGDKVGRDQFFAWALKFYNDDIITGLDRVAATFLQECPVHLRLEVRSWLRYVENLVARVEIKNSSENVGIYCGNLDGAIHLELDTVVLLGLDSDSVRIKNKISFREIDQDKIAKDLGFNLALGDHDWSYWIERVMENTKNRCFACFALHDLKSRVQSPSSIWSRAFKTDDDEGCETPGLTRWDEIQNSKDENENRRVAQDGGGLAPDPFVIETLPKISPSQLEKYLDCPFQFAAEKIFHLSELPDVDLDVDAMTTGRLLHEILNLLTAPPMRWDWSQDELSNLVDHVRSEFQVVIACEPLWPATRSRLVQTAGRFLNFEKKWRETFRETKTVLREGGLKGCVNCDDAGAGLKVEVAGRIDRVDQNAKGQYVVLDYKTSGGDLRNHNSWFENNELQLLFYSYCIENGLTELPPGPVVGAFYFTMNEIRREKGFRDISSLSESSGRLFDEAPRGGSHLTRNELDELYKKLREKIGEAVGQMKNGNFVPNPRDFKICEECNWRTLCRAPHLN